MNPNESNPSIKYAKVASGEGISYPQELTPYIQKVGNGYTLIFAVLGV